MSLKELNDNWEKQFIGARFDKRLEQRLLEEHRERMLREIDRRIFESVVVSVLDRRRRIKAIGFNDGHKDLILNNFGRWLAALIRAPVNATLGVSLTDVGGSSRNVNVYFVGATAPVALFNDNSVAGATTPIGTRVRVGSGTTTPSRTDYEITTPFTTAPENALFDTGSGSYAAGVISFSGAISAGGSGTVNETGFYSRWWESPGGVVYSFMLFHDVLATGVSFSAGQIINVSYSISL